MNNALLFAGAGLVAAYLAARSDDAGAAADAGMDESVPDQIFNSADDFLAENFGVRMGNWLDDLNGRGAAYKPMLAAAEQRYGIPSGMLARLAWQESRFRADIITGRTVSSAGAVGIMQIIPRYHPGVDPLNPGAAIDYAGRFLAGLYKKYGSWELALKAYNWGAGNVDKWLVGQKAQPNETRLYSQQILADVGIV